MAYLCEKSRTGAVLVLSTNWSKHGQELHDRGLRHVGHASRGPDWISLDQSGRPPLQFVEIGATSGLARWRRHGVADWFIARRVVRPVAHRDRPFHHGADPLPYAPRGLRLVVADRS